jgi:hypothetical protein
LTILVRGRTHPDANRMARHARSVQCIEARIEDPSMDRTYGLKRCSVIRLGAGPLASLQRQSGGYRQCSCWQSMDVSSSRGRLPLAGNHIFCSRPGQIGQKYRRMEFSASIVSIDVAHRLPSLTVMVQRLGAAAIGGQSILRSVRCPGPPKRRSR